MDAPPPSIVALRVSKDPSVDADGEKVRVGLKASVEVWEKGAIELQFDRYLDPRTATRASFCLSTDTSKPKVRAECVQPVDVAPAYDPVTRTIVLYLKDALESDTQYQLTLFKPTEGDEETEAAPGLRAFDGVPFARTLTFQFDTAMGPLGDELEAPTTFEPDCYGELDAALSVCSTCHKTQAAGVPAGLNLSASRAHLNVGRVAHQTQEGGDGSTAQATPLVFGTNMPIIEADAPGNSYLLYKALAAVEFADGNLAAGEADRLRDFISGYPMPASPLNESTPFNESVHYDSMKYVSRWIAAGAPECPAPQ